MPCVFVLLKSFYRYRVCRNSPCTYIFCKSLRLYSYKRRIYVFPWFFYYSDNSLIVKYSFTLYLNHTDADQGADYLSRPEPAQSRNIGYFFKGQLTVQKRQYIPVFFGKLYILK